MYKECNFRSFFSHPPSGQEYRESEFLDHHKVPESVKTSLSPVIHFDKIEHPSHFDTNSILFKLKSLFELSKDDPLEKLVEQLDSLGVSSYKVLQFGTLTDIASKFKSYKFSFLLSKKDDQLNKTKNKVQL